MDPAIFASQVRLNQWKSWDGNINNLTKDMRDELCGFLVTMGEFKPLVVLGFDLKIAAAQLIVEEYEMELSKHRQESMTFSQSLHVWQKLRGI